MTNLELDVDQEETTDRRMDDELRVMGQILRILRDLEAGARERVIAYLSARFERSLP